MVTDFRGGGLRMDYDANTATCLRFGYDIIELSENSGLTATTWKWKWGVSKDALTREVSAEAGKTLNWIEKDGKKVSNLVITGIPVDEYTTTVYSQLITEYASADGDKVVVYTAIQEKSVEGIANKILAERSGATEIEKEYAEKVLVAIQQNTN